MIISLLLLSSMVAQTAASQRLLGANEVLREIKTPLPSANNADPTKFFAAKSMELRAKLAGMSPKSAAAAWVGLVREWETRAPNAQTQYQGQDQGWGDVMKALPGPDSWPMIRQGLVSLPPVRTAPII